MHCANVTGEGWFDQWQEGPFFGNGLVGGLFRFNSSAAGSDLRMDLGRTDVWDRRKPGTPGYINGAGDLYMPDAAQLASADAVYEVHVRRIKAEEVIAEKDAKDNFVFPVASGELSQPYGTSRSFRRFQKTLISPDDSADDDERCKHERTNGRIHSVKCVNWDGQSVHDQEAPMND